MESNRAAPAGAAGGGHTWHVLGLPPTRMHRKAPQQRFVVPVVLHEKPTTRHVHWLSSDQPVLTHDAHVAPVPAARLNEQVAQLVGHAVHTFVAEQ